MKNPSPMNSIIRSIALFFRRIFYSRGGLAETQFQVQLLERCETQFCYPWHLD